MTVGDKISKANRLQPDYEWPHAMKEHVGVVYALVDRRDNRIRYVGVTQNLDARMHSHIYSQSANEKKEAWIQDLWDDLRYRPVPAILERVTADDYETYKEQAESAEQWWMRTLEEAGASLLNKR